MIFFNEFNNPDNPPRVTCRENNPLLNLGAAMIAIGTTLNKREERKNERSKNNSTRRY